MKYLYQQLLAFWSIIILTVILIGVSFTNINRRTLEDQNYTMIEGYLHSVAMMLDQNEVGESDNPSTYMFPEDRLPYVLSYAEKILTNQSINFVVIDNRGEVKYPESKVIIPKELFDYTDSTGFKIKDIDKKTIKKNLLGERVETSYVTATFHFSNNLDYTLIASKSAKDLELSEKIITENLLRGFIISVLFGGAISFALAARQVKKINDLKQAVNQIANGNYEITIEEKDNKDEFNELAHDFNRMTAALQDNEKEIIRQEELRKQFMANTSHEMKTPLTTIKGLLEGLRYDAIPEAQKGKAIVLMQNETERLTRLVQQNLDYENIRSHQITLSLTRFDATEAIKTILSQLEQKAKAMNDEFILLNQEKVEVYADRDRFIQIMVNVIQNAIQFTEDGQIKIDLQETDSEIEITIEDNGIGMTKEEQKNIWDRYYKADPSRKNTKLGESGLGLSIVKELVHLHQGTIDVSSRKNEGTVFTIRFPKNQ